MSDSLLPPLPEDPLFLIQGGLELPEALQLPTRRKTLGWQLSLTLANLAVWMCTIPIFQILLPNQLDALDAANKVVLLSAISFAGGISAILGNLLAGAFSDRTTSRFGRRRPWILGGAILSGAALALLGLSHSILLVALGIVAFQFCVNVDIASLAALVPDQVPVLQRATVSGFVGLTLPLGTVIGLTLTSQAFNGSQTSYFALTAIIIVILAFFVLVTRDPALPQGSLAPVKIKGFIASFVSPLHNRDFALTFFGRLLVIVGYYPIVGYLLYYFEDAVHYNQTQATQGVTIFQILATIVLIVATISSGVISDRLQRRKPFVITASCIMTVSLFLLAFFPIWPIILVAAAVMGLGFGIFLSGDLALQTQVLPERGDHGKDLGILNAANLLAQTLVPIVAGIVLAIFHNYAVLFLIGGVATLAGALLILPVKAVR